VVRVSWHDIFFRAHAVLFAHLAVATMGNLSPIGDYEKDRMQEIITTSVTTFTKEFAMAVPLAVVQVGEQ
jgi:hypothetical protein